VYGTEKQQEDVPGIIALKIHILCFEWITVLKHLVLFFILLFLARYKVYIVNLFEDIFVQSG